MEGVDNMTERRQILKRIHINQHIIRRNKKDRRK